MIIQNSNPKEVDRLMQGLIKFWKSFNLNIEAISIVKQLIFLKLINVSKGVFKIFRKANNAGIYKCQM